MRHFMRLSLFGLFLLGLSLLVIAGLPLFERIAHELGWRSSQLAAVVSTCLDPVTARYMAAWGTLVVLLTPISFAALDLGEVRSRRAAEGDHVSEPSIEVPGAGVDPLEPNIDQIYKDRQLDLYGDDRPLRQDRTDAAADVAPGVPIHDLDATGSTRKTKAWTMRPNAPAVGVWTTRTAHSTDDRRPPR